MEQEIKRDARKQYLKYFRVWFIVIGILFVIWLGGFVMKAIGGEVVRGNAQAPTERVYDLANVLTDSQEQNLREYIAECEEKAKMDIVLVTVMVDIEAMNGSYDSAITNLADDFYDENLFGYDEVHGDGILLLDNWYDGQEGSRLAASGRLVDEFSYEDRDYILDQVYYEINNNPYEAYRTYVETATVLATGGGIIPFWLILIVPVVVALIFAFSNLSQAKAKDTTNSKTYVAGGNPVMRVKRDDFLRKNVVSRRIQTNSGNSGGGRSGGGAYRSSSGVRHSGTTRRR